MIFGQIQPWRHLCLDSTGIYGISPLAFRRTNEFSVMNEARVSGWRNDLSVSIYSHLNQVCWVVSQFCPMLRL
jgi:hypothetical protein